MSDLDWLQNWYLQTCNGDWEHQYGMSISTLDNPGWQIAINLKDTPLEKKNFATLEKGKEDDEDWYQVGIETDPLDGPIFTGYCSPQNLTVILGHFKKFTEKGA